MNQLSVKVKILLLAAVMLVITCLLAIVGIYSNHQAKQHIDDLYHHNLMTTQYLSNANIQLRILSEDIDYVILQEYDPADRKLLLDEMNSRVVNIQENVAKIKEIDRSPRAQENLELLTEDLSNFAQQIKACEKLQNTPEDKIQLLKHLSGAHAIGARLSRLTPDNVLQGKILFQENDATHTRTIQIFLGIILIGLIAGIGTTILIAGNIATPLEESVRQLNAVADGNLTQEISPKLAQRRDEVGSMVKALQKMQTSLRQILGEVQSESDENVAMAEKVQELVERLDNSIQDMTCVMELMVANMEKTAAATADVQQQINILTQAIAENSNALSPKLAASMEMMNQAMGDIARATIEGAVDSTAIAEKVADVAVMAEEILDKVNESRQGAENLKQQVERFQV